MTKHKSETQATNLERSHPPSAGRSAEPGRLMPPSVDSHERLAIEQDAAYYFREIRKFQPLDLDHLSLENWKDFIVWREGNRG